jgi:hypothetical protein
MAYYVIFFNDAQPSNQYLIGTASTLQEAQEKRQTSGDVVVDDNGDIVVDRSWLFIWEDDKSYAARCIQRKVKIPLRPFRTPENTSWCQNHNHISQCLGLERSRDYKRATGNR